MLHDRVHDDLLVLIFDFYSLIDQTIAWSPLFLVQPQNETVYTPIDGQILVNFRKFEEISFASGPTFFGNIEGQYEATREGEL